MLKIGIDGGGTTTRAVVIEYVSNDQIRVLGRGEAGSSNHYGVGLEVAAKNIGTAIGAAQSAAGIGEDAAQSYGFGLAGACTPAEQSLLAGRLGVLAAGQNFVIDEDAAAAQAGAFAGGPGAICIAGTGANCFGINEKNERARADGLGPLLGDRGGGYRIGEAALRAICAAEDDSGTKTSLVAPCLRAMGISSIDELVQLVYQPGFARSRVAALFPVVVQTAQDGDGLALELLQNAGRELATTTLAVLKKLRLQRVAPVGGVFENSEVVRTAYEAHLSETIPALEIVAPQYGAAIGAALLAK
jgi:N-acetylglucosamine kinase-like BadF-type ATPase